MPERIYLSPPHLSGTESAMVDEAIASNWIAPLGPAGRGVRGRTRPTRSASPGRLRRRPGRQPSTWRSMCSGCGPGDVVIGSSFTFIGSVSPVRYVGAEPWFVDSSADTWNMDPDLLEQALAAAKDEGRKVGAVIAVDLFGQCADYARIEEICDRFGAPLIEDAAEALGATCGGRQAGSYGRVGILSFNGNKIITTSAGGAMVSDDGDLLDRAFFLATQAREEAVHYEHAEIGYNYRMSNLLAAVGRAQLATLDERVEARRRIFDTYVDLLESVDGIDFMPEAPYGRSNRWLTTLTIDPGRFGASTGRSDPLA